MAPGSLPHIFAHAAESGDQPFPRPPDLFITTHGFLIGPVALVAPVCVCVCVPVSSSAVCLWHPAILEKLYPAVAQWKVPTFALMPCGFVPSE